jgi:hypothetical protein
LINQLARINLILSLILMAVHFFIGLFFVAVSSQEPYPFARDFYLFTFLGSVAGLFIGIPALIFIKWFQRRSNRTIVLTVVLLTSIPIGLGIACYGVAFGAPDLVRIGTMCRRDCR